MPKMAGLASMFGNHLQYAARALARKPAFALGVVLILGLTAGGLAAVGTAVWSLLLKPLPFDRPEYLVTLGAHSERMGFNIGLSPGMIRELEGSNELSAVAAYESATAARDRDGRFWRQARISANLLETLGQRPLAGRGFTRNDAEVGAARVGLIGERTWRERFGGSPHVIGTEIELEDGPVRIVGVLPAQFSIPGPDTQLWVPMIFRPEQLDAQHFMDLGELRVIARLHPGTSAAAAGERLHARYGNDARLRLVIDSLGLKFYAEPLQSAWTRQHRGPFILLGAATTLLLVAAVLNLAGLWMARWLGRSQEIAIQIAVGSGRWQATLGSGAEFLVLAVPALIVAMLTAIGGIHGLYALGVLSTASPVSVHVGLPTLLLGLAVLVAAAVPVLLAVAWQTRGLEQSSARMLLGGGATARSLGSRSRKVLVVSEIALAMSLLSVVGLLLQSWIRLLDEKLGFEPRGLVHATIQRPLGQPDGLVMDERVEAALRRIGNLPGVRDVAYADLTPFGWSDMVTNFEPPNSVGTEGSIRPRQVSGNFFRVAQIPILAGQAFGPEHLGSNSQWVLVDQLFARQNFPEGAAVGQRFRVGSLPGTPNDSSTSAVGMRTVEILGVTATSRHLSPDEKVTTGTVYFPLPGAPAQCEIIVRTDLPPPGLVASVKRNLEEALGADRVGPVVTMQGRVRETVADREPQLILLGVFGGMTLVLAGIGLFALLSYSAQVRVPEFGLRLAIGAQRRHIAGMVLRDGLYLLIPGVLFGTIGAWVAGRLIADRLYQIAPANLVTWLVVASVITAVVIVASLQPAVNAMRTHPVESLRHV